MASRSTTVVFFSAALVAGIVAIAACVGDDPAATTPDTTDGGSSGSSSGSSGSSSGSSGSSSGSSGTACTVATCSDPSTLTQCDGGTETCLLGCLGDGGAHCGGLQPSGIVAATDLTTAGALDVTLAATTRFVTDTGAIDNLRAANADPQTLEVKAGIGFRLGKDGDGNKLGIWTFKSLTIPDGITVTFTSANAAAFVATRVITVVGVIDARGYDAIPSLCIQNATGPGGGVGGTKLGGAGAAGPGKGSPSPTTVTGASGGSFGGIGGTGGPVNGSPGADAGTTYGNLTLVPLLAGSGGGASSQAYGGGGGGAIQIVAGEKISIGGGPALGGINAGGCNGEGGGFGASGGAGGSGGAILLESPVLELLANGRIVANGGGGGSGSGGAGQPGRLDGNLAAGGPPSGGYGFGGTGSASTFPNGGGGASSTTAAAGAGAGAAGRIRINNRSSSFTPPPSTLISPAIGISPNPPTTIGEVAVH